MAISVTTNSKELTDFEDIKAFVRTLESEAQFTANSTDALYNDTWRRWVTGLSSESRVVLFVAQFSQDGMQITVEVVR